MEERKDLFEQQLDEQTVALKACQEAHSVTSCMQCNELIGCETRSAYVKSVYNSMSKGDSGGFEF
jgi:hypothetical protein